jgi:PAS domain S-box-containing protein
VVQRASDLTVVTRDDGAVGYASPAAERMLGDALTGELLGKRAHPDDLPVLRALVDRLTAAPGADADAEVRFQHADGTCRWPQVIGTDLRGNSSIAGVVRNGRDITEARRLRDELRHRATHDALTGLANRALLQH